MKIGIISDIHANLPALKTCLNKLDDEQVDEIICLGDLVGYGPFPDECCNIIRQRNIPTVLGNHDGAITGDVPFKIFREPNHSLLKWTLNHISSDNKSYLASLNLTMSTDTWFAAHASPVYPEKWHYLESAFTCREVLKIMQQDFIFVGHTHKPAVVAENFGVFNVKPGERYVINPGSVGQSRDNDLRASFGILDTGKRTYQNVRLDYPIQETLDQYAVIGFSEAQANKLLHVTGG